MLTIVLSAAAGEPPPALRRGINITHWFRYPPSRDPKTLRAYLSDSRLEELKRAGFTFVRLAVQPDMLEAPDVLAEAIARVQRHGLAVVVALFADGWHLESDPADRVKLLASWRSLAPLLGGREPAATFPEVLNEPVFADNPQAWAAQHKAIAVIRASLPRSTIVLSGAEWGSISGLLSLPREIDRNVIYSFHMYEPAELTALGAYRPGLDRTAMARLPFPVTDQAACKAAANTTSDEPTTQLMRFYCEQRWNAPRIITRIGEVAGWAKDRGAAVLASEFGASQQLNEPARLAWLVTVRLACEQRGIGWALWGYDDPMGFALRPPADRPWIDPAVLRALGLMRSSNREELPRHLQSP